MSCPLWAHRQFRLLRFGYSPRSRIFAPRQTGWSLQSIVPCSGRRCRTGCPVPGVRAFSHILGTLERKSASYRGMFIPSETAIISASVDDLEFSFWILELEIKSPTGHPCGFHIPWWMDFKFLRLTNAASIDTITLGGISHPSLSGTSLVLRR